METAWMLASSLGFLLDVFVYHTFPLFLKSVMKLRTEQRAGGGDGNAQ